MIAHLSRMLTGQNKVLDPLVTR